ncbi:Uncharacterized protein Rs2_04235 [Raphanus sativus]|nr:Uncharacterized protein Rs2_04235 [Raphanus sativus]
MIKILYYKEEDYSLLLLPPHQIVQGGGDSCPVVSKLNLTNIEIRISHKRRYLEAFFTETPSKHEAIQVSDVTQSWLISHGSVDVKFTILLLSAYICMFASLPLTSHGIRFLTLAKLFPQHSRNNKRKVGEKKAHTTMRRTRRCLATQPRRKDLLCFSFFGFIKSDKGHTVACSVHESLKHEE